MMVPSKIKEWCIAITFWQQKNARGVIQLITATIIKTGSGIKAENEFRYPTLALYKEGGFHNFTIHTLYMSNNDKLIPKLEGHSWKNKSGIDSNTLNSRIKKWK